MIDGWLDNGQGLCTSSICWYEFLSGPVDAEGVEIIDALIGKRVLPFGPETAALAALLFNVAGRARRLRVDSMIAAAAILEKAELATENTTNLLAFSSEGLRLAN